MDSATADVKAALVEANRAYEERFGHVFLIFATGRTDTEMLAAARDRLANDDETERERGTRRARQDRRRCACEAAGDAA